MMIQEEDDTQDTMPARSRLYSLAPLGLGMPLVESLTGYIARLATTHKLPTGTLFGRMVAPLINKPYIIGRRPGGFSKSLDKSVQAMNGFGVMAQAAVQALEELTLREDLRYLTLLSYQGVFSHRFLLYTHRVWCSVCYETWADAHQPIYEPLLWSLKPMTICPVHQCRLRSQCPKCKKQLSPLSERSRPGYCSKCNQWLGEKSQKVDQSPAEDETEIQVWIAKMIGELLATAPQLSDEPTMSVVSQTIEALIQAAGSQNRCAFGKSLGVGETMLGNWCRAATRMRLDNCLRFCHGCQISPLQLFTNELQVDKLFVPGSRPSDLSSKTRAAWGSFDQERIKTILADALANEAPPPSVKSLAERLGYHPSVIFKYFPSLAKEIAARHKMYRQECSREYVGERKKEIRTTVEKLMAQGIYPSRKAVSQVLNYNGNILQSELKIIRAELGLKGKL